MKKIKIAATVFLVTLALGFFVGGLAQISVDADKHQFRPWKMVAWFAAMSIPAAAVAWMWVEDDDF